jgi:hypothetical protein
MGWRILVNFIRQSMLKLKTHSGFHDLFLKSTRHEMMEMRSAIINGLSANVSCFNPLDLL